MWSWSHNFHHQNQYFVAKAHWLVSLPNGRHLSRTGDSLGEPPDLSLFRVALNTRWHWRFSLCRELNLATNLISGRYDKNCKNKFPAQEFPTCMKFWGSWSSLWFPLMWFCGTNLVIYTFFVTVIPPTFFTSKLPSCHEEIFISRIYASSFDGSTTSGGLACYL